jgi:hypothetical protein
VAGWSTETTCGVFVPLTALAPLGARAEVLGILRYERVDPFAVRLECHLSGRAPVVWRFARETLEAGVRGRAGVGNVTVCGGMPEVLGGAAGDVYVVLHSSRGHVVLRGPRGSFRAFLARSRRLVPYGEESENLDFDALVARLIDEPGGRGPDAPPAAR